MIYYQKSGFLFNSFNEYCKFSLDHSNEIEYKFWQDIQFSGKKRPGSVPNPQEYKLDDDFFILLRDFILNLNRYNIPPEPGLKKILFYLEPKQDKNYLEYLVLIICFFLIGNKSKAIYYCYDVFKLYERGIISVEEVEFVIELFKFLAYPTLPHTKKDLDILVIMSPKHVNDDILKFEKLFNNINNEFKGIKFNPKYVNQHTNWNSVLADIYGAYDLISIFAHGSEDIGLGLLFKNQTNRTPFDIQHMNDLKKYYKHPKDATIFLLGCMSMKYREEKYKDFNRISTSTGWSVEETEYFIYGFLKKYQNGLDLEDNFNSGKMSLMMRAHSVIYIHLDKISQ